MEALTSVIATLDAFVSSYLLVPFLAIAGVLFTVRLRGFQFRSARLVAKVLLNSRSGGEGGISSFQAFCISLASRVGTGNIAGVALALVLGGPGAIFWMWVMALIGMATAFVEATLAQLYKQPHRDGTFRGGPAYYMERGLGSRPMGIVFAILLIFAFGISFQMVQANTIGQVLFESYGLAPLWTALILVVLTGIVIFGGLKAIARVTEIIAPLMALIYFLLALVVLVLRLPEVPAAFMMIIRGAFGLDPALAGLSGGMLAALINGVRRGMFSNEAGMGSAPNAAATATTSHPAHQGVIQAAGVFVDTIIVCSATAIVILLAGPDVYTPGRTTESEAGAALTQNALATELGDWSIPVMSVLIFVFAFSSVLGNTTYAEINVDFLHGGRVGELVLRGVVVVAVFVGTLTSLTFVWTLADVAMTLMALTNLVAVFLLGKYAVAALRDLQRFKADPAGAVFDLGRMPEAPPGVLPEVWATGGGERVTR